MIKEEDIINTKHHNKFDMTLHNAITFAAIKHDGQKRKGTNIPYISHPMEVMQILTENICSESVIIAGLLHDVLEDTDTTQEEILNNFGEAVLKIVAAESEDKSKSWEERKQATIDQLCGASIEVKLVCCADKLSNIRSMYADLHIAGEKLWDRFNAPKEKIRWYYESIILAISEISETDMYKELKEMTNDVFCLKWGV